MQQLIFDSTVTTVTGLLAGQPGIGDLIQGKSFIYILYRY